ncbi:hypothetical protein [Hyphomicrobium sp.]|uniref:hypothetical protein n=1 Tax=Hyphomicrobium sp. TaxID=82 RepID=UPI002E365E78|nr:hypothetical protein [Hyphomicrobium sp.]HEX2842135.1 hypothetical protein [Hyphomicrobium sp.]
MTSSLCDKAIEILQATRDGEDLDPKHLKLVELAVNGILNETGLYVFEELLRQVRDGYVKPWFHGVQHITRNHEGYVFWRGVAIEHYSSDYAASDESEAHVRELARRCVLLEGKGITPSTNTVIWKWRDF